MYRESLGLQNELISNNDYQYTEKNIQSLKVMNEFSDTPEVSEAITQLLRMGKEITSENVTKYRNITDLTDKIDVTDNIPSMSQLVMQGNSVYYSEQDIQEIKQTLEQIDDEIIGNLLKEDQTINIKNARDALLKNTTKVLKGVRTEFVDLKTNADLQEQVREIRAKLNVETAQRLSTKMPLESEELSKVAEGLRQVEKEIVDEAIEVSGLEDTIENRKVIQETIQGVNALKASKGEATYFHMKGTQDLSLKTVHEALANHEMIEPQIEEVLKNRQLENTEEHKQKVVQDIITEVNTSVQRLLSSKEVKDIVGSTYNEANEVSKLLFNGEGFKEVGAEIAAIQHQLKEEGIEWSGVHKQNIHQAIEEHPVKTEQLQLTLQNLENQLEISKVQGGLGAHLNYPELLNRVGGTLQEESDRIVGAVLGKMALEDTDENRASVKNLIQSVDTYKAINPIQAYKGDEALSAQVGRYLEASQGVETTKETRFGEGVHKIENQIKQLLENTGVPIDDKNIEAAKALIQNDMDVTPESIEQIRPLIETIEVIVEDLTPYKAAHLMKEGIDPYKASLDHVANWLLDQQVPEMKESVAEAIVGLDEKNLITESQKKGLIGVYRILNALQEDKEKIMGYMHRNELPVTMEKIDEAIRYHENRQGVISTQIDDTFGALEKMEYSGQTAKQMIHGANQESAQIETIVKDLEDKVLTGLNKEIQDVLKDEMKSILKEFEGKDVLSESLKEKLDIVKQIGPKTIEMMEKNNIPVTLSNLHQIDQFEKNIEKFKAELMGDDKLKDKLSKQEGGLITDLDEVNEYVEEKKKSCMLEGDLLGYKKYSQLEEVIEFQQRLEEQNNIYVIPMMVEGELKTVNFYMNKKSSQEESTHTETKMIISYDTTELGRVRAEITLKNDQIDYRVSTDRQANLQKLEESKSFLKESLNSLGFEVNTSHYNNDRSLTENFVTTEHKEEDREEIMQKETGLFELIV